MSLLLDLERKPATVAYNYDLFNYCFRHPRVMRFPKTVTRCPMCNMQLRTHPRCNKSRKGLVRF
jgi:hypothetical protein